jgi:hypothetical protein
VGYRQGATPSGAWFGVTVEVSGERPELIFVKQLTDFGPIYRFRSDTFGEGRECATIEDCVEEGTREFLIGGWRPGPTIVTATDHTNTSPEGPRVEK